MVPSLKAREVEQGSDSDPQSTNSGRVWGRKTNPNGVIVKKVEPEYIAQVKVVRHLRARGIGVFSVPNGAMLGGNKYGQLNKLKAEGLLPGAPDLVCLRLAIFAGKGKWDPAVFKPVVIEMKRPDEKLSDNQKEVLREMTHEGWHVIIGYGSADAIGQIDRLSF